MKVEQQNIMFFCDHIQVTTFYHAISLFVFIITEMCNILEYVPRRYYRRPLRLFGYGLYRWLWSCQHRCEITCQCPWRCVLTSMIDDRGNGGYRRTPRDRLQNSVLLSAKIDPRKITVLSFNLIARARRIYAVVSWCLGYIVAYRSNKSYISRPPASNMKHAAGL